MGELIERSSRLDSVAPRGVADLENCLKSNGNGLGLSGSLDAVQQDVGRPPSDVAGRLHEGSGRTAGGGRAERVQRVLVSATVSLALVLLVGAGLLVRSFNAFRGGLDVEASRQRERRCNDGCTFRPLGQILSE